MTTAKWLAQRLDVSERTVYRDVADLQDQEAKRVWAIAWGLDLTCRR